MLVYKKYRVSKNYYSGQLGFTRTAITITEESQPNGIEQRSPNLPSQHPQCLSDFFRDAPRPKEVANNSINYIARSKQFNKYICPNSLVAISKNNTHMLKEIHFYFIFK